MLNLNVGVYNIETGQAEALLNINRAALIHLSAIYTTQQTHALWVKNDDLSGLTIVTGNANISEIRRNITGFLSV